MDEPSAPGRLPRLTAPRAAAVGECDEWRRQRQQRDEDEEPQQRACLHVRPPFAATTLTHTHKNATRPAVAGLVAFSRVNLLARPGRAAVGVCDERSREREQTDCEHNQRAVQMSDLAHRSLLPVSVGAPVTLGQTANRSVTNG